MCSSPIVVLAEDNEDTRRVYGLILRHYGYRVEEAITGEAAIELVRALRPALVLMDIGLPGIDGWQASRLLKADPLTAGIPTIAFSAHVDSTADLGAEPSFDGYILKPISPKELVGRVHAYMTLLGAALPEASPLASLDDASGGSTSELIAWRSRSSAPHGRLTPRRTSS